MHSMTFMILLVFLMLLAFYTPAESLHFFKTSDECPTMQEIPSCDSILASKFKAYIYQVPQNISTNHCEHGWYYQNGTFIVDSTPDGNGKKFEFVMDVTPQNLTVSACMNLQWQIHCEHIQYICAINYTVLELKHQATHDSLPTNVPPWDEVETHNCPSLGIGLTVICIILGIVGLTVCSICYCRQNPRNRTDYVAAKQNGVEL
ncbi:uncharacterized protein LOC127453971 isoform X2 [Myxocyprinus asiaticus]|uniref:uncharacterized protein LOC127453971 isoform X2 n=1 Tax=Myxocyprinus asiaticus TaxID=70543 RepID=UPI002223DD97|nr:uncharacterized protein LOC127453971 isoform X2 [Myxocyprinus asiaticus]